MFIKLIGASMILVSGSSVGWLIGSTYLNRIRELKDLQVAINVFDTEISYGQVLLPEALKTASKILSGPNSRLFYEAAKELESSGGQTFAEIWSSKTAEYYQWNNLLKEDMEILLNWGRQIGTSTLPEQIKINQKTLQRLEQHEQFAREIADKRVKLVRYAGILVSLLVIILFY